MINVGIIVHRLLNRSSSGARPHDRVSLHQGLLLTGKCKSKTCWRKCEDITSMMHDECDTGPLESQPAPFCTPGLYHVQPASPPQSCVKAGNIGKSGFTGRR